jgi:hypothetical protein
MRQVLIFTFFFIAKSYLAQHKKEVHIPVFYKGYVINAKNEKIEGEVKEFKNDMDAYMKISFREKEGAPIKQFIPAKIHGYGFENRNFASIKWFEMWVFMEVLSKGIISVYEFKPPVSMGNERMESQYFVIKGANKELAQIFPDNKLKKQIREFISDDKELLKTLDNYKDFKLGEFLSVVEEYNQRHVN